MAELRVITTTGQETVLEEATVEKFQASLRGPLLRPGDAGYDDARQVWNAMIDRHPALIARCAGAADVLAAVTFARTHHLLVSVRGGGLGWLAGKYGLTGDNLLSADVVTAEGQLLTASATEHADLFWGLRGGGGNFGVVTSFEYLLHPVGPVLAGMVLYPFTKAKEALTVYRDFATAIPDEVNTIGALLTSPDGVPVAAIGVCYNGDLDAGDQVLRPLRAFGPPLADGIRPMAYTQV
jgi:hypothetical protein